MSRYSYNDNYLAGQESFTDTIKYVYDTFIYIPFDIIRKKLKRILFLSSKNKHDYIKEFVDLWRQTRVVGRKLDRKQMMSYFTKLMHQNKWPNEVIYTERDFERDFKKYCPNGVETAFGTTLSLEQYKSSCPGQCYAGHASELFSDTFTKYDLEKYCPQYVNLQKSYFGKILYRTYAVEDMLGIAADKGNITELFMELYVILLREHERQHSRQSKKFLLESNDYGLSPTHELYRYQNHEYEADTVAWTKVDEYITENNIPIRRKIFINGKEGGTESMAVDPYENINLTPSEVKVTEEGGAVTISPDQAAEGELQEEVTPKPVEDPTYTEMKDMILYPFFGTQDQYKVGVEAFAGYMDAPHRLQMKPQPLLIRTNDDRNFRVYMTAQQLFTQQYIVNLCNFLDTRTKDQSVTFVLGTKMMDHQAHMIGAIVSAMEDCAATVNTIAAGYCSIPETMIWCFGKNRDVFRYGALSFCTTEFISVCEKYKAYFEVFLNKAKEIGVLSDSQVQGIWDTGKEVMVTYNDYQQLHLN